MKEKLAILGFCLLLICVRLYVATTSGAPYERGEEYVRGAAAIAVTGGLLDSINAELESLDEPTVGPEALFYHPYEGGGFVHALLTVPAFAWFGPSLLAHKFVAIGFELLVLLAGFCLVREVFGPRALLPFGLLWIFSPLPFQELALLNLGIHYQALVFQFSVAALGLGVLRSAPRPLSLGLLGGFGLFYNYQLAPLIGLLALAFLAGRHLDLRGWGRLVLGFALGGLPLWWMLGATGTAMFDIHGQTFGNEGLRSVGLGTVLANLVANLGPRGWLQLLALLGLGLFAGLRGPRAARGIWVYLLVFALLIPVSGFLSASFQYSFGAMRYAQLFGFLTVLAAGALSQLPTRLCGPLLAVLLAAGVSSTLATANTGDGPRAGLDRIASIRGTDFGDYFSKLQLRLPERLRADEGATMRAFSRVQGAPRAEVLAAATRAGTQRLKRPLAVVVPQLQAAFGEDWYLGLDGIGGWAMYGSRGELARGQRRLRQQLLGLHERDLPAELQDVALEEALGGLGHFGTGAFPTLEALDAELQQMASFAVGRAVYVGFGRRVFRAFCLVPRKLEVLLAGREPEVQERVRAGFERERLFRATAR